MCGAIRYECSAKPIIMGNCYCRNCQRATGTAFAATILVPRNSSKRSLCSKE
ncbi:GFA family protein [Nostoc flagelliforme]|uniref:GFA family protein n=1 Tax=Nostoc flagelliforme TaxID=1306274 RepID=UPI003BAEE2CE